MSQACTKADVAPKFFNRPAELQYLRARLQEQPNGLILLTGPPNCGKTVRAHESPDHMWLSASLLCILCLLALLHESPAHCLYYV